MFREYLAVLDNGNDYIEFKYYSEYRSDSKKNMEDLKEQYRTQYGHDAYEKIRWYKAMRYLQKD